VSAAARAQCEPNSCRRILVVDDDIGIGQSSAGVLIRYATDFAVKHSSINCKQNQAANAVSECRL
jgi:hypothetical protein